MGFSKMAWSVFVGQRSSKMISSSDIVSKLLHYMRLLLAVLAPEASAFGSRLPQLSCPAVEAQHRYMLRSHRGWGIILDHLISLIGLKTTRYGLPGKKA